jgi:hypothetical protein
MVTCVVQARCNEKTLRDLIHWVSTPVSEIDLRLSHHASTLEQHALGEGFQLDPLVC